MHSDEGKDVYNHVQIDAHPLCYKNTVDELKLHACFSQLQKSNKVRTRAHDCIDL